MCVCALSVQVNIGILISVTRIISRISAESYKVHGDANAVKWVPLNMDWLLWTVSFDSNLRRGRNLPLSPPPPPNPRCVCRLTAKAVAVLLPILGIAWIFGVLTVNTHSLAFLYIFAVFNSLQVRGFDGVTRCLLENVLGVHSVTVDTCFYWRVWVLLFRIGNAYSSVVWVMIRAGHDKVSEIPIWGALIRGQSETLGISARWTQNSDTWCTCLMLHDNIFASWTHNVRQHRFCCTAKFLENKKNLLKNHRFKWHTVFTWCMNLSDLNCNIQSITIALEK